MDGDRGRKRSLAVLLLAVLLLNFPLLGLADVTLLPSGTPVIDSARVLPLSLRSLVGRLRRELVDGRAGAERALAEAQAAIRALQAKLAHTELAHAEALAIERRAREHAEAVLREETAREAAERRLSEPVSARASVEAPAPRPKTQRAKAGKTAPKTSAAKAREPKPVKWWLPDYKASTKAP